MANKKQAEPMPSMGMAYVAVGSENGLNLRKAASMDADILTVLPKGVGVFVDPTQLGDAGAIPEWLEITTGNLTGYVVSKYLVEVG